MTRYFCTDLAHEEVVITREEVIDLMASEGLEEVEVFMAEPVPGTDTFFCEWEGELAEWGPGICGRTCKGYRPINGVSGKCKDKGLAYISTGRGLMIKSDGAITTPTSPEQ